MKYSLLLLALLASLLVFGACSSVPNACRGLEGGAFTRCIVDAATSAKDPSLCTGLENNATATWCVTSVAVARADPLVCDRVENPDERAYCKVEVIKSHKLYGRCAETTGVARDVCFDFVARATSSWQTCLNMSMGDSRESCIEDIARKTNDPQGCTALPLRRSGRDSCLFITSIARNDTYSCGSIIDDTLSDYCLINVAVKLNNASLCDEIPRRNVTAVCRSIVRQEVNTANLLPSPAKLQ